MTPPVIDRVDTRIRFIAHAYADPRQFTRQSETAKINSTRTATDATRFDRGSA